MRPNHTWTMIRRLPSGYTLWASTAADGMAQFGCTKDRAGRPTTPRPADGHPTVLACRKAAGV